LYLDVVRRRRDGYHDIETLFQSVGLADELEFTPQPQGVSLTCSDPALDTGPGNLVTHAAFLLQQHTGCARGASITLTKRIPIAAGLAGGSGDAAATLVGLNALWDLGLPPARLQRLGLMLGSDVPYCLVGGTVAATGRGERLTPLDPLPETWLVLVHPPLALSTKAVYASPDLELSPEQPFAGRTPAFRRAIQSLHRGDFPAAVFNRMETAAFRMYPELSTMLTRLRQAGCTAAAMSGSGPTLFGVCKSKKQAERVAAIFTATRASVVSTVSTGLAHPVPHVRLV
jgi:4-diphosphocytidyl-2-C-methyl-D-erythritol kinase